MAGVVNRSFVGDDSTGVTNNNNNNVTANGSGPPGSVTVGNVEEQPQEEREKWNNGAEFLLSCIAMSVGLGNVWKFPSTAFRNGGGAFVIPYLIVLLIVGRPIYYLEMVMGQFSSRGSVKVYDVSPLMRGTKIPGFFCCVEVESRKDKLDLSNCVATKGWVCGVHTVV